MPISDQMFLAATTPPDYMKAKLQQATLRNAILQNQHAAIVNPQVEEENRQKLETGGQAVQQGALSLLTAQQDQEDGRDLRARLQAASKPAAPAPNMGQVAGPQSTVLPGVIGAANAPAPAPAQPQTWDDVADQYQQTAQPRNYFAFKKLILENKEKAATLQKTLMDTSKTQAEVDEKKHDFWAGLANGVKDSGYNRVYLEGALHAADTHTPETSAQIADIRRQLDAGASVQSIVDPMISTATAAQTTALAHKAAEVRAAALGVPLLSSAQTKAESDKLALDITKRMAAMTPDQWKARVDSVIPATGDTADLNSRTAAMVQSYIARGDWKNADAVIKDASDQIGRTETGVRTAQATAPIKVSVNAQEAGNKTTQVYVPDGSGGYTVRNVTAGESIPAGAVTAAGMSSMNVPTANTRGMAEKAPRVIQFTDRINQLLDENEKYLGPLGSRWSEYTAGKIGLPNKGYTQLRTDMGLLTTALMNMHVGARGGGEMMHHFQDLIDSSKQSPENLRAALGEIRTYAQTVQSEGHPANQSAPAAQPAAAAVPANVKAALASASPGVHTLNDGSKWRKDAKGNITKE